MGRDRFLNKFVITYVTHVSDENRPLIAHKHFETPRIPLQSLDRLEKPMLIVSPFSRNLIYVN